MDWSVMKIEAKVHNRVQKFFTPSGMCLIRNCTYPDRIFAHEAVRKSNRNVLKLPSRDSQ